MSHPLEVIEIAERAVIATRHDDRDSLWGTYCALAKVITSMEGAEWFDHQRAPLCFHLKADCFRLLAFYWQPTVVRNQLRGVTVAILKRLAVWRQQVLEHAYLDGSLRVDAPESEGGGS